MIARETVNLLRLLTAPFLVVNRSGEVVFANQPICKLLQLEKSLLTGRSVEELAIDPPEKTSRTLKLFFGSGDWLVGLLSLRKADGSAVEFPCKGCVVQRPTHDQPPLVAIQFDQRKQFQAISQKIDELNAEVRRRRQVEEQLRERSARLEQDIIKRKQVEKALRRSETKFRSLFDSTRDAMMLLDEHGFFDCNKMTIDLFGCASKEEFCSYHPADLSPPTQLSVIDSLTLAN